MGSLQACWGGPGLWANGRSTLRNITSIFSKYAEMAAPQSPIPCATSSIVLLKTPTKPRERQGKLRTFSTHMYGLFGILEWLGEGGTLVERMDELDEVWMKWIG